MLWIWVYVFQEVAPWEDFIQIRDLKEKEGMFDNTEEN